MRKIKKKTKHHRLSVSQYFLHRKNTSWNIHEHFLPNQLEELIINVLEQEFFQNKYLQNEDWNIISQVAKVNTHWFSWSGYCHHVSSLKQFTSHISCSQLVQSLSWSNSSDPNSWESWIIIFLTFLCLIHKEKQSPWYTCLEKWPSPHNGTFPL